MAPATTAGLTPSGTWSWFEPGYFGVPLMGMLGWGCFGLAAAAWLPLPSGDGGGWRVWAAPVVSVAATHALLLAIWWAALRWVGRGDLAAAPLVGYGVLAAAFTWAIIGPARGRRLGWHIVGPRMAATSVFLALLVVLEVPHQAGLWTHVGLASVPYLMATRWRRAGVQVGARPDQPR